MDLNNLTLDELLEQIKGGSFTQAAVQPAKEEKEEIYQPPVPKAPEPVEKSTEEPVSVYEPVLPETVAEENEPEPDADFAQDFFAAEESATPEPTVYDPAPVAEQNFLSLAEETDIEDEPAAEPMFYAPPQAEEPIEIIEDEPEEPSPFFTVPDFPLPAPLEIAEPDKTEEPAEIQEVPTTVKAPAEPEGEGNFRIFGNINFDADMNSIFPDVQEDSQPDDTADEKTRRVGDLSEKTAVFERPGIITGQKLFEKTGDLRAIPAILSAEDMLKSDTKAEEKTFIRTGSIPIVAQDKAKALQPQDDAQMMLPGFNVPEEPEVHVDENKVEDELRRNRSKKVDSFRLEGVEEEEPSIDEETYEELSENKKEKPRRFSATKTRTRLNRQSVEYRKPADKARVSDFIAKKKLTALVTTIVTGICAAGLLVTTGIPAVAAMINQGSADFCITSIISLVLIVIAFAASIPNCISGVTCFTSGSGKPNTQTPVFLSAVAATIQAVLLVFFDKAGEIPSFAAAAALILCACSAGKLISFRNIQQNFEFLASTAKDGLHTVRTVDNMSDANRIGRNVVIGEADIRYSGRTNFVTNFLAYSMASDSTDDLCAKLVPIVSAASAVIGIIAGFVTKSPVAGISLFAGAMCIGAPASAAIAANLPLFAANKNHDENGGIITSYAGAFEYESTNALALDAQDIFPDNCCNIHGMKTFYGVRIDDAILTAASMLVAAGGPISGLFSEVVMGRKELLMNVEELVYEDRLGLSGWVRGRRVFVGNRKLLENHNIEIPVSVDEAKYRHDGRRVLYLADAGKIAAMFVVSYGTDEVIAEQLRKIENSGINLLIRTTDSNITEEYVANCFGLPLNSVKIVSSNAGDVLKNYAETVLPKADATLVHNGSAKGFLHCVSTAGSLCSAAGVISTQQTICSIAGLLLMAVMVIFSGALNVNALQICICQLVWAAVGILIPKINRN